MILLFICSILWNCKCKYHVRFTLLLDKVHKFQCQCAMRIVYCAKNPQPFDMNKVRPQQLISCWSSHNPGRNTLVSEDALSVNCFYYTILCLDSSLSHSGFRTIKLVLSYHFFSLGSNTIISACPAR